MHTNNSIIRLGDLVLETGEFDPDDVLEIFEFKFVEDSENLDVSFVVPVYNQESLIASNLQSIVDHSKLGNEIIVVIDGCTDSTLVQVRNWVENLSDVAQNTQKVTLVVSADSHFETISDMIGVSLASGTYVLEVQADMTIEHPGFDQKLIQVLKEFDDIVMVSGRGTHSLNEVQPNRKVSKLRVYLEAQMTIWSYRLHIEEVYSRIQWRLSGAAGRLGPAVDFKVRNPDDKRVFLSQTVMRGPIIFNKSKFLELGGFDTSSFFLGNDDHDFSLRAWTIGNLRTAYTAVAFTSPLEAGSTRAEKTELEKKKFQLLLGAYAHRQSLSELSRHWLTENELPKPEIRYLN